MLLTSPALEVLGAWHDTLLPSATQSDANGVAVAGDIFVAGRRTTVDDTLALQPWLVSGADGWASAVAADPAGRVLVHATAIGAPTESVTTVWDDAIVWERPYQPPAPASAIATAIAADRHGYVYAGGWTVAGHPRAWLTKHHP